MFRVFKNDADTEVAESCCPTYNDMLRLNEFDTDLDMPHLMGPSEIQPNGRWADPELTELMNPGDFQNQ